MFSSRIEFELSITQHTNSHFAYGISTSAQSAVLSMTIVDGGKQQPPAIMCARLVNASALTDVNSTKKYFPDPSYFFGSTSSPDVICRIYTQDNTIPISGFFADITYLLVTVQHFSDMKYTMMVSVASTPVLLRPGISY
jgi:hypothetical protein